MSTTKTKKEAKLKARKTSLSKKTNEELIEIILKKDNTERKNNDKIMNLTKKVDDLNVIIDVKKQEINEYECQIGNAENEIDNLREDIHKRDEKYSLLEKDKDNLQTITNSLKNKLDSYYKDINRIKMYKMIGLGSIIVNVVLLLIIFL